MYGAADDVVLAGQGGDGLVFEEDGAHGCDRVAPEGWAASALVALGFGGAKPVVGQLPLEIASGGEGLHRCAGGGR